MMPAGAGQGRPWAPAAWAPYTRPQAVAPKTRGACCVRVVLAAHRGPHGTASVRRHGCCAPPPSPNPKQLVGAIVVSIFVVLWGSQELLPSFGQLLGEPIELQARNATLVPGAAYTYPPMLAVLCPCLPACWSSMASFAGLLVDLASFRRAGLGMTTQRYHTWCCNKRCLA
jgi:hypothetical protein